MPFTLMADSNSDFPHTLVDRFSLPMIYMPYLINGDERYPDLGRDPEDQKRFFAEMRKGASVKTSLLPQQSYYEFFEPYLQKGIDILYISFSFQLSQTQSNAQQAANELKQHYPERTIRILDTQSISMGFGLLLYEACLMKEQGRSMEEIERYVLTNRQRVQHWFTVDDLVYLRRGGRLGAASAIMGTILDVKPIITVNPEGKLVPFAKTKGRRKAMKAIVDQVVETIDIPEERILVIMNADCPEDGQAVEQLLRERMAPKEIWHVSVGQVVGTHCGPGTLAIVHLGNPRRE